MFEPVHCGMMLNRETEAREPQGQPRGFFICGSGGVTCVKTLLSIDTRDLNRTLKEVGAALGPDKMNIALKHTIQDTGRKVRTLVKSEIRKEYHAKAGRIGKAIGRPQYSLGGTISCIIPVRDVRGTIATDSGGYTALKRGPGAKIVKSGNSVLPHAKTDKRIHFYIPSGRLQGHVFVRHNDGIDWTGKRREGTGETEVWKTKKGKRKRNRKVQTTGERKRIGTISHGVGIGIPQMPMNRSADEIQEQVGQYAMERLLHYEEAILKGIVTR